MVGRWLLQLGWQVRSLLAGVGVVGGGGVADIDWRCGSWGAVVCGLD